MKKSNVSITSESDDDIVYHINNKQIKLSAGKKLYLRWTGEFWLQITKKEFDNFEKLQ